MSLYKFNKTECYGNEIYFIIFHVFLVIVARKRETKLRFSLDQNLNTFLSRFSSVFRREIEEVMKRTFSWNLFLGK